MTNTEPQPASDYVPDQVANPVPDQMLPYIRLPGIASFLFFVLLIPFLLGGAVVVGSGSRRYFEGAPTQATLGTMLLLVGVAFVLTGLVLVGMRSIAQQQVDALSPLERDGAYRTRRITKNRARTLPSAVPVMPAIERTPATA